MRPLVRLLYAGTFCLFLPACLFLVSLPLFLAAPEERGVEVVVVLGTCRALLRGRVRRAAKLCNANVPVVFTGAFGEAALAAEWFKEMGGSAKEVFLETNSTTTYENALFTRNMLQERQMDIQSMLLVSDAFHSLRSIALFRQFFPSQRISFAATSMHDYTRQMLWSAREVGGIVKGLALGHFSIADLRQAWIELVR